MLVCLLNFFVQSAINYLRWCGVKGAKNPRKSCQQPQGTRQIYIRSSKPPGSRRWTGAPRQWRQPAPLATRAAAALSGALHTRQLHLQPAGSTVLYLRLPRFKHQATRHSPRGGRQKRRGSSSNAGDAKSKCDGSGGGDDGDGGSNNGGNTNTQTTQTASLAAKSTKKNQVTRSCQPQGSYIKRNSGSGRRECAPRRWRWQQRRRGLRASPSSVS
jgi:hypothetical protein